MPKKKSGTKTSRRDINEANHQQQKSQKYPPSNPLGHSHLRFPSVAKDQVFFMPLGGSEEVGMNAYVYGCDQTWILVDLGIGFNSDPQLQGVDISVIDPKLLSHNRDLIKAVFITHAHEDHIGALPHLSEFIATKCPIYATTFARTFLSQKLGDEHVRLSQPIRDLPLKKTIQVGPFEISAFPVRHSIPESRCLAIRACGGLIIHSGDWKNDHTPKLEYAEEESQNTNFLAVKKAFPKHPLTAFVGESTNAPEVGHAGSEGDVYAPLIERFKKAPRRLVVTLFASNLQRLLTIMRAGRALGREPCLIGHSMWRIWNTALQVGLVNDIKPPLNEEVAFKHPPKQILFIVTGCQAEPRAILTRIAHHSFRALRLEENDTVVFSSSIIPGNEHAVFGIENQLASMGINIIKDPSLHVSGHACQQDLRAAYEQLRPPLLVTIHGEVRLHRQNAIIAKQCKIENIATPSNGQCIRLNGAHPGRFVTKLRSIPYVLDGETFVQRTSSHLLRRQRMAKDGEAIVSVNAEVWPCPPKSITMTIVGLYDYEDGDYEETDHSDPELITICKKKIASLLSTLHKPKPAELAAAMRLKVRRTLYQHTAKRPEVTIHLFYGNAWHSFPRAL